VQHNNKIKTQNSSMELHLCINSKEFRPQLPPSSGVL
jgi:hypothetical protein